MTSFQGRLKRTERNSSFNFIGLLVVCVLVIFSAGIAGDLRQAELDLQICRDQIRKNLEP